MAHEIETMAYFGKLPWHGLGTALGENDCYDWPIACRKAGLDWDVDLVPLITQDTQIEVTHRAIRRSTDNVILGVVGPRYVPLQNTDAFSWFQPFLETKEASLHTAGSLRGGSRIWVLAKINRDPLVISKEDVVEKFILLSHGHDGSLAVRAGFTPIRVVCQNTLSMAHGAASSKLIRFKHTKDVLDNLAKVREVMNLANQEFEATAEQYRFLARKSINQTDLCRYVKKVLKVDDEEKTSTRTKNVIQDIIRLAHVGRGNTLSSIQGTYWAAYNGVTEWLSYHQGHNRDNRLNNLWFGDNFVTNQKALEIALDMAS